MIYKTGFRFSNELYMGLTAEDSGDGINKAIVKVIQGETEKDLITGGENWIEELIWENPTPTKLTETAHIIDNYETYPYYKVVARGTGSSTVTMDYIITSATLKVAKNEVISSMASNKVYCRRVWASGTRMEISNHCQNITDNTEDSTRLIPVKVYGIRKEA